LALARRPRAAVAAAPSSPVPFPFAVPAAVPAVQPAAWEVRAVLPRAGEVRGAASQRAAGEAHAAVVPAVAQAHVAVVLRAVPEAHAAVVLRAVVLRAEARAAVPRRVAAAWGASVAQWVRWARLSALPSAWVFPQVPPWPAPRPGEKSLHKKV
jgi:hypothetical protein